MYSDEHLKELREDFLRESRPKEYRRLKKAGELEAHLQREAERCRRRAQELVDTHITFLQQAWQWAIREVLLETEWD